MADDTMKWWRFILLSVSLVGIGYLFGRTTRRNTPIPDDIVKVDTLYRIDTITQIKPIPQIVRKTDTMEVFVQVHDTIREVVTIPMEQKVYTDTNYRAVVSGFRPSLDSISVFPVTKIVMQEHFTYIPPPKFGFSVQVGTGLVYDAIGNSFGFGVYGGVGVHYCFGGRRK